ncbi:MAG: hypothetical protein LBJ96_00940 [Holosporaceae bacterium]|jgi:hypothetical protein|nr:hypothetical protein [Holosporaceae bacterium]
MESEKIALKIESRLRDILDIDKSEDKCIIPNRDSFSGFNVFLTNIASFTKISVLEKALVAMDDDGCCTLEYYDELFFLYVKFKDKNNVLCNFSQKEGGEYVTKYFSRSITIFEFSKKVCDLTGWSVANRTGVFS